VTPTLVVLRVDGHGTEHLSLHTKRGQAEARLVEVGRKVWRDRFGYDLAEGPDDVRFVADRLVREGWRVRLAEEVVEL
jgi:hypothetical protein